jgi:trans-aconitate 2-methyltransferase
LTAVPWDPDRYNQFKQARSQPFEDLFALIGVRPGLHVLDLGCGTGELTRSLAERLPQSDVLGIDSSAEMLAKSESLAAREERFNLRFELAEIQTIRGHWDLVVSNSALQWLEEHANLIPRLFTLLEPGGQLVVQIPSNHDHPTHRLLAEAAAQEPYRTALDGWRRRSPVLSIERYAELLFKAGGRELEVYEKVYPLEMEDANALVDWACGTALIPYLERLPEDLDPAFIESYRRRLWEQWPLGPIFYAFRRILFSARRPA